jgi:hypothetical protein
LEVEIPSIYTSLKIVYTLTGKVNAIIKAHQKWIPKFFFGRGAAFEEKYCILRCP